MFLSSSATLFVVALLVTLRGRCDYIFSLQLKYFVLVYQFFLLLSWEKSWKFLVKKTHFSGFNGMTLNRYIYCFYMLLKTAWRKISKKLLEDPHVCKTCFHLSLSLKILRAFGAIPKLVHHLTRFWSLKSLQPLLRHQTLVESRFWKGVDPMKILLMTAWTPLMNIPWDPVGVKNLMIPQCLKICWNWIYIKV